MVEPYASELHNLTPEQLKNIENPDNLDNDQRDLIALHIKTNYLPFPTMTKLSEKRIINNRFVKLKDRLTVCMYFVFGMSHCRPW